MSYSSRNQRAHFCITFNSPVVLAFVALCFIATLLGIITGGATTEKYFMTYHSALTNPWTYLRFFTHVLGHSGWSHFLSNAAYLLLLGPILEERYGSLRLVKVILITALVTGLVNYILFPNVALCGASGVVFAFIIMISFTGFRTGEIPMTLILVVLIFIGEQIVDGVLINDNISNMAHIVGGAVGAALGYLWKRT